MTLQEKSLNWWFTKLISSIALVYLVFSLASQTDHREIKIENSHLLLLGIVLLFNSDFIEKIESFTLGDLSAKFATKQEVKQEVNKLGDDIATLLIGTALDAYEYITLQKIKGDREDSYELNDEGLKLVVKLRNRGLIQEKPSYPATHDSRHRNIKVRDHFLITPKGEKYLEVINQQGLGKELENIAALAGYKDKEI